MSTITASGLKGPRAFLRNEGGNFAILFALSGSVLILTMGLGIDYFVGVSAKARLDAAADAAALGAVNAAKAYYQTNSGSLSLSQLVANAEAQGQTVATAAFKANVASTVLTAPVTPTFTWAAFSNLTFSVTVNWSGQVPTIFGNLASVSNLGLSGSAAAQSQMPLFEDFYVFTDVSGSMGIPTAVSDQQKLMQNNPDNAAWAWAYPQGCQFACHFSGSSGFAYTQNDGSGNIRIPLKLNDVATALSNLRSTALNSEKIANQYRIGVFPYIDDVISKSYWPAPLSSDLSTTGKLAQLVNTSSSTYLANYVDAGGTNDGMNAGGTHFSSIWTDIQSEGILNPVGNGYSSASPQPYIIIITDGVDNMQSFTNGNWSSGGSEPKIPDTTSSSSVCTNAKNAGYTVAVLLITYTPIYSPLASFANNEDGWVNYYINQSLYAEPVNSGNALGTTLSSGESIVTNMQACASPNYFFQASSSTAINDAMQQIFYQATNATRLTQ